MNRSKVVGRALLVSISKAPCTHKRVSTGLECSEPCAADYILLCGIVFRIVCVRFDGHVVLRQARFVLPHVSFI